jgi:hypothetical protein
LTFETSNNLSQTVSCDLIYINNSMFMVGIFFFFLGVCVGLGIAVENHTNGTKIPWEVSNLLQFLVFFFSNLLRISNSRGPNFTWPIKRELL